MLEELNEWLIAEKSDWRKGLELYRQLFPERLAFMNRVQANPSEHHIRLMRQELANYFKSQSPQPVAKTTILVEAKPEALPMQSSVLDEILKEQQYLWNRKAKLSNSLADFAYEDVAGRALVVTEILKLREQYNELAEKKNYYMVNGQLPVSQVLEEKTLSLAELRLKLQNEQTNKSKKQARLKQAKSDQQKLHYQEAIAIHEAQINYLKNKIKIATI
jgi:hypothetical protein